MTDRPRFILALEAEPDPLGRDPITRVRQLLRLASRGLGLRCLAYRRVLDESVAEDGAEVEGVEP